MWEPKIWVPGPGRNFEMGPKSWPGIAIVGDEDIVRCIIRN